MTIQDRLGAVVRCRTCWVLVLFVGVFWSAQPQAQVAGATLSGTVTDLSGATIATAKVSIKNLVVGGQFDRRFQNRPRTAAERSRLDEFGNPGAGRRQHPKPGHDVVQCQQGKSWLWKPVERLGSPSQRKQLPSQRREH